MRSTALLAIGLLLIAGCGGEEESGDATTSTPASSSDTAATEAATTDTAESTESAATETADTAAQTESTDAAETAATDSTEAETQESEASDTTTAKADEGKQQEEEKGTEEAAETAATDDKADDGDATEPLTPEQQYEALTAAFAESIQAYRDGMTAAKTQEERLKVRRELYPQPDKHADGFLKLAAEFPESSVAVDSLMWVATQTRGDNATAAMATLFDKHSSSERMSELVIPLAYGMAPGGEERLRKLLESSPHKSVKGTATFGLAMHLTRMRSGDEAEIEKLYETVVNDYADVEMRGTSIAQQAEAALFEIRHLSIGKVAPDIVAADLDGVEFKLSDYRGKVVLLDFWGHW